MSYITYKQADSRWGKKNYNGSSTMATAGCGPTSVAMLAYAVDGKTNPWDVALYMKSHGYAIRNNGTAWAGIPAAMKHFGLTDVKNVEKMSDVFSYLSKGYCAVFLFRAGTRGNITWTTSGHYVAVTGYKVQNGKHYLYTRDSGGRDLTGWYAYETQMRGLIPQVWVGKVPTKAAPKPTGKPTGKYSGVIPVPTIKKGVKGDNVKNLQKFLNWYCKANMKVDGIAGNVTCGYLKLFQATEGISADGIYGKVSQSKANAYKAVAPKPKTKCQLIADMAKSCAWSYGTPSSKYKYPDGSPTSAFKKAIEKAYPDRSGWGKQTRAGASCDVFVGTVIRSTGYDTKFPRGLDGVEKHCKDNPLWKNTGIRDLDELKPGDVVFYLYKRGGHIYIYVGNGKIANAHYNGKTFGIIQKLSSARKPAETTKFIVYRAAK
jgi:peptidoglycan hydrolase-like protein with peptidoglycan-binding domain